MNVFGISDLHLSFTVNKPQDVFGPDWVGHHEKIARAWRARVADEDLVLVPGDISWALKTADARADLEWLGRLPGRKVIVKGNHDYWWPKTRRKMAQLLPPGMFAMKGNAVVVNGIGLVGVRGCDIHAPEGVRAEEHESTLRREIGDFERSIEDLRQRSGYERVVCLFHYPPFDLEQRPSLFTEMVERSGAELCVYGHLHTPEWCARGFQGVHNNVEYRLLSCDHLDFEPLLLRRL